MSSPTLYFGQKDGNTLYRADQGSSDAGAAYTVIAKPRPVAPAGAGGECIFRSIYLVVTYSMACVLRVTPILDGQEFAAEAKDIALTAQPTPVTQRFQIGLSVGVADSTGTEAIRLAMRGAWFTVKIETVGALGDGVLELEGIELEYKVVRESMDPVTK